MQRTGIGELELNVEVTVEEVVGDLAVQRLLEQQAELALVERAIAIGVVPSPVSQREKANIWREPTYQTSS